MSRPLSRKPLIALVHNVDRAFQTHMVRNAHAQGLPDLKPAHNHVFGVLGADGDRAAALAARAGITRQSMGELVRELVGLGILETVPDPADGRAKVVRYSQQGQRVAAHGMAHLGDLERRFAEEFGADYEVARTVLERVIGLLEDSAGQG